MNDTRSLSLPGPILAIHYWIRLLMAESVWNERISAWYADAGSASLDTAHPCSLPAAQSASWQLADLPQEHLYTCKHDCAKRGHAELIIVVAGCGIWTTNVGSCGCCSGKTAHRRAVSLLDQSVAADLIPAEAVLGLMAESWLSALAPFDSAATGGAGLLPLCSRGACPQRRRPSWAVTGRYIMWA